MKPTFPKIIFKRSFFSSDVFAHLYPSLVKLSTEIFNWNKTDKTPTFNGNPPLVTILTMLEDSRISQDGMADKVSENIVAELSTKVTFGGFSEERMQSLLE